MRRRVLLLALVAALVAGVVAVLSTGLGRDPAATASPLVGRTAPDFTLSGLDGPAVTLSTLRGQVVIVNFWASWCAECHDEQDALDQTWQRYRDAGAVVLGVDFQDTTDGARDYVHQSGLTYPVVEDKDSRTALAYGIRGIPETFLLDRSGRIVNRIIGRVDAAVLAAQVDPLVRTAAP
ncbi:MAG TPA: TlpA disulfide reductase family protein [Mycobacteriales bacterium]|jgi:cytochrome c biogenesis protein CcmG/thiol:disulfide interchange protein DsbE|nr:TlpA disulfide reductase family protein [Mycobacteriales bacterium]